MTDVVIRLAGPRDAEALAELAARTFRDTFADNNQPDDMNAYLRDAFSRQQVGAELRDAGNVFLLAFAAGSEEPAGYGKLRDGPVDISVTGPDPVEIERLYVDRDAIGHGVGAALMQAMLDEALSRGFRTVWLGVWEHNPRAIRFYEKWGFETVGSHVFRLGADDQTDLIMERCSALDARLRREGGEVGVGAADDEADPLAVQRVP